MALHLEDRQTIYRMVNLGVPVEEIAETFGITPGDVQRHHHSEMVRKYAPTPLRLTAAMVRWSGSGASLGYRSGEGCKWPIGDPLDPAFQYCDQPRVEGRPYCTAHMQVGYKKASKA